VQGDRTEVNRALNNLKIWDIPQDEIDALHAEAKKISADLKMGCPCLCTPGESRHPR